MLLFDTELRPSPIHGIGVFLLEDVREGDLIWRFDSRIDRIYSDEELNSLPPRLQEFLKTYSTWWVLCGDNGRHFNHSDTPNTISLGVAFSDDVAATDIPAGTELTSDYRTICDTFKSGASDLIFDAEPAKAA
jgi:SET domain-containing protein